MGPSVTGYREAEGPPASSASKHLDLAALASAQHGVVSGKQLHALGFSPQAVGRLVAQGRLARLHVGVYAVGHLALTSRSRELAAVLACGPDALASHRTAAALHALMRLSWRTIEVTVPRQRKPRPGIIVHRSRVLHPEDVAVVDAIQVTSVARTIVDLADVVSLPRLRRVLKEAELHGVLDVAPIERTVERVPSRRGRGRLRQALALYTPDTAFTRSGEERRFLRLCRDHGLPRPQN